MKDLFSRDAESYAKFRPRYPQELFVWLASLCSHKQVVWDCATGNGQAAAELSKYFTKVIATDISQKQLDAATKMENIYYELTGTTCNVADCSVDLITIAQALHWLPLEQFYTEVTRVAKPSGIIAAWCYRLLEINPEIDNIIFNFYEHDLKGCWDPARTHIDDGYINLPFTFKKINAPAFYIKEQWTLEQLTGYLNTWSSIPSFINKYKTNPIPSITEKLRKVWGSEDVKQVIFPLQLKIGNVH